MPNEEHLPSFATSRVLNIRRLLDLQVSQLLNLASCRDSFTTQFISKTRFGEAYVEQASSGMLEPLNNFALISPEVHEVGSDSNGGKK